MCWGCTKSLMQKNYSLDSRSLVLFRISIGLILLINLFCTRLPFFELFHSENGFLPLRDVIAYSGFFSKTTSLNFIYAGDGFQIFLFGLFAICAFCLLIGWQTKWMLFGSWVLLFSLHAKNELIINSGDNLLVLLLFWSLLLPLNNHVSTDNALLEKESKPFNIYSVNSVGFIGQLLMVYIFAFLLKTDMVWKEGSGVYYALMLDNFRTKWGDILLSYPWLMEYFSDLTYYFLELSIPILFLLLGWLARFRTFLIILMIGFHLSLALFLELGLFSWICMAGWLALLPSWFWEKLKGLLPGRKDLKVYYDESCFFCRKAVHLLRSFLILPHVSFMPAGAKGPVRQKMDQNNSWLAQSKTGEWKNKWQVWVTLTQHSPVLFFLSPFFNKIPFIGNKIYEGVSFYRQPLGRFISFFPQSSESKRSSTILNLFFAICFIYALFWNIRSTDFKTYEKFFPKTLNGYGRFFHLHQYWAMFAPKPLVRAGWHILSAELKSGLKVDLLQDERPVVYTEPVRYNEVYPGFRHRKMIENLVFKSDKKPYRRNYLKYLCRKYNKDRAKDRFIQNIEFIYMEVTTPPLGQSRPEPIRRSLDKISCS